MSEIRSAASYRGSFKQGGVADLLLKITDFDGNPKDPSFIECKIEGPVESPSIDPPDIEDSSQPFQITTGYYVYSWDISSTQTVGDYLITWTYIVDNSESIELQTVTVVESADNTEPGTFYTERLIAFREALEFHISCSQSIPIYFEQSKPSRDNTKFEFSFANWNQSPGVKIYRNDNVVTSDAEIDYFNGTVTFDTQLLQQEKVNADYNFRWFDEDTLTRFLVNAVQNINTYPPFTTYNLDTVPDRYVPAVLYGAAADALRQLMFCVNFQQPAQIFGGPDEAQKVFGNFETLKQNYEKQLEPIMDNKKRGPFPLTLMIVTPEYTLPGGRSRWFRYLFK